MNWLNPDKTLREQDISVDTVVNLRKRLFFPEQDRAVDTSTPVLLNTVYEEVRQSDYFLSHFVYPLSQCKPLTY